MQPSERVINGRYRLLNQVAVDATGVLWRAGDEQWRREVWVREVRLPGELPPAEQAAVAEQVAARLRAGGPSHPALAPVWDVVTEGGAVFVVTPPVPGQSLRQVVAASGPLPADRAAQLGLVVLDALEAAHAGGVAHGGVSTSTVYVASSGAVVVIDFGVAAAVAAARGAGEASPAADLHDLGSVLYFAVEGVESPRGVPQRAAGLTPVLYGLLAEPPEQRWNAWQVRAGLMSAAGAMSAPWIPPGGNRRNRRAWIAAAVATIVVVALGTVGAIALTDSDGSPTAGPTPTRTRTTTSPTRTQPVTLTVGVYGDVGYESSIEQYQRDHPNVTVRLEKTELGSEYNAKLSTRLAAGQAPDVVMVEESYLGQMLDAPDRFADISGYLGDLSGSYVPWAYEHGRTGDGKKLIALPSDAPGMAICYRKDLFKAAGLPEGRDAVAALWPTWERFIETGKRYRATAKKPMLDTAVVVYSAMALQRAEPFYVDRDDRFVADTSASVKYAWDTSVKMIDDQVTARLKMWTPEWTSGFATGAFAATACPIWMLPLIKNYSGTTYAGKWDIAPLPGGGGGNWGGTWLTVPAQGKDPRAAAELAHYLSKGAPSKGQIPTSLQATARPADTDATVASYFSNAPITKTYTDSITALRPVYRGPHYGQLKEQVFEPALQSVESRALTGPQAWQQALTDARLKVR